MANAVSPSNEHLCNNVIPTQKDKLMKAALNLILCVDRMIDLRIEIENNYNVLKDPNSTIVRRRHPYLQSKIQFFHS